MKLEFTQDTKFSIYDFKRGQIIDRAELHESLVGLLIYSKRVKLVEEKEAKKK